MNVLEKEGVFVFFGKVQCGNCYIGLVFNSMEFYGIGLGDLMDCLEEVLLIFVNVLEYFGWGGFINWVEDMYKFKVFQLYNFKDFLFYGYGGILWLIWEVIEYKNKGVL